MPLSLIDVIQRGRQGGAEHGRGEDERQQPERDPAGSARPSALGGGRLVEAVGAGLVGYAAGGLHGRGFPLLGHRELTLVSHADLLLAWLDHLGLSHRFPGGGPWSSWLAVSITPANRTGSIPASRHGTGPS